MLLDNRMQMSTRDYEIRLMTEAVIEYLYPLAEEEIIDLQVDDVEWMTEKLAKLLEAEWR